MAPCIHCGQSTTNTTELYVGGSGYETVPYCGPDEGCSLIYAAWLRHELSEAEYIARYAAGKAA